MRMANRGRKRQYERRKRSTGRGTGLEALRVVGLIGGGSGRRGYGDGDGDALPHHTAARIRRSEPSSGMPITAEARSSRSPTLGRRVSRVMCHASRAASRVLDDPRPGRRHPAGGKECRHHVVVGAPVCWSDGRCGGCVFDAEVSERPVCQDRLRKPALANSGPTDARGWASRDSAAQDAFTPT